MASVAVKVRWTPPSVLALDLFLVLVFFPLPLDFAPAASVFFLVSATFVTTLAIVATWLPAVSTLFIAADADPKRTSDFVRSLPAEQANSLVQPFSQ